MVNRKMSARFATVAPSGSHRQSERLPVSELGQHGLAAIMLIVSRQQKLSKAFLTRLQVVLPLIEEGHYQREIAIRTGMSHQLVCYWTKQFEQHELITRIPEPMPVGWTLHRHKSNPVFYELTQSGKRVLDTIEKGGKAGRGFRLENLRFKYTVLSGPEKEMPSSKEVHMKHWNQSIGTELGYTWRLNQGKEKSLEILVEPLWGRDPFELYFYARSDADAVALSLAERFGMQLGLPVESSRPEIAIDDPVSKVVTEFMNVKSEEQKWDRSPGKGEGGEAELITMDAVSEYIHMPRHVKENTQAVKGLAEQVAQMAEALKGIVSVSRTQNAILPELARTIAKLSDVLEGQERRPTSGSVRGVKPAGA